MAFCELFRLAYWCGELWVRASGHEALPQSHASAERDRARYSKAADLGDLEGRVA